MDQDPIVELAAESHSSEVQSFLALSTIRGIGFETLRRLASRGDGFSSILDLEDPDDAVGALRSVGAKVGNEALMNWRMVRERAIAQGRELHKQLASRDISVVLRSNPAFPAKLLDLSDPPFWIFVQGDVRVLHRSSIGVVGTRSPSSDGLWLTNFVGYSLDQWDAPTVSGLAMGIDQEIHAASLRARVPTVAVLGTGIFSDYPRGSDAMRASIIKNGGAVITEYLPDESYSASNFVRRNRLQAALSSIVIPVEWKVKSGTAHTVNYAARLNRPMAMLRVPSQASFEWLPDTVRRNCETFTIPSDFKKLSDFVTSSLALDDRTTRATQLNLFDG